MNNHVSERFWSKVDKTDGCWVWIASKLPTGYGQFWSGERNMRAHRFSYILHYGNIPNGMLVCHKCDNPSCVRPDHLFLGTSLDNAIDKVSKGRNNITFTPITKFSDEDVRSIREARNQGMSLKRICEVFNISRGYASDLCSGNYRKKA